MAKKEQSIKEGVNQGSVSKPVPMPLRETIPMNITRSGTILSNLTIAIFCFAGLLGLGTLIFTIVYPFIVILNYLFAIGISVLSLGLIYAAGVNFSNLIWFDFGAINIESFFSFLGSALPIALWVAFGISLAAFVLLLLDKRNKKIGRIVFCGIVMVLSLVLALLIQLGGIVIV